jgi:hypothetical protein
MWWNPAESGWGINVMQQNDTAFFTFFVYGPDQKPIWYTFSGVDSGDFSWSGTLYLTQGPYFGGAFSSTAVSYRAVGTAVFQGLFINQATLTYTVDGTSVTKNLQRQTWKNENLNGTYAGGYSARLGNCSPSSQNGLDEQVGLIYVTQSGLNVTISASLNGGTCNFTGQYSQTGKLGKIVGTYSCVNGVAGTFNLFDVTRTISGFNGRLDAQNQYCTASGYFGGITRAR